MPHISGPLAEFLGDSLGIAAVLLVAGWLVLRWQQDQHRFVLMRTALEKGITRLSDAPPFWLLSIRQGVTMAALGVALAVVGGGSFWLGRQVPIPKAEARLSVDAPPPPPQPDEGLRGPERRPPPPRPNPEMERWHQAQVEQTAGLGSVGIGFILLVVGVVRIVFAQAERQYAQQAAQDTNI
jgi:hypothetical protein